MAKGVIKIALCMWSFLFFSLCLFFLPHFPPICSFSFYSGPDLCAGGNADTDHLDIRFLLLACGVLFSFPSLIFDCSVNTVRAQPCQSGQWMQHVMKNLSCFFFFFFPFFKSPECSKPGISPSNLRKLYTREEKEMNEWNGTNEAMRNGLFSRRRPAPSTLLPTSYLYHFHYGID